MGAGAGALPACKSSGATTAEVLPPLGTVGPFWLSDHEGRTFSEQSLTGKVWVAAFMFTRCPTICPEMTRRMQHLQTQAKERDVPLSLVSFSVDPENDTAPVLRAYMQKFGVDGSNWSFVTGDSTVIRDTAEKGFKIGVAGKPDRAAEHFGITHGTHFVLLDSKRTIRGYYQSSDPARIEALLEDAARLAKES